MSHNVTQAPRYFGKSSKLRLLVKSLTADISTVGGWGPHVLSQLLSMQGTVSCENFYLSQNLARELLALINILYLCQKLANFFHLLEQINIVT